MEIETSDHKIWYEPATATLYFKGVMREAGIADYKPTEELLQQALADDPGTITMNIRKLEFLNSSGTSVLSRFIIGVRKKKTIELVVQGSKAIPWHEKIVRNWQRLMPALTQQWE